MEFIAPFMLFILGWHPERPGELDLQRPEIVFLSVEECEAAGEEMAARMTEAASGQSGARYEHRCMTFPAIEEVEKAFEPVKNLPR